MHTLNAGQCGALSLRSTAQAHLRPSRPSHARSLRVSAAQGRQQQQQQQQPISNYRDLMQQYKSIVPAAPAPSQKSSPNKAPSAGNSKDTKGSPRLKPTKQSSAASGTGNNRSAAAAAGAPTRSKSAGFGAAADRASGAASKLRAQSSSWRERTREESMDASSSTSTPSSSSRRSADSSRSSSSSSNVKSIPRPAVPSGWLLPSNGKGFGSPLPSAAAAAAAAADAPAAPAAADRKGARGGKVLKVFRFGVESTAVSKAIEACGWQGMLDQVESIKAADLILAAKCSSTGKHRNLAQGRKAATNAGIPFVVVGRKLSPETFRQALIPYLEPNSKEAAALAAAAAAAAEAAASNKAAADAFFASAGKWGRGQ